MSRLLFPKAVHIVNMSKSGSNASLIYAMSKILEQLYLIFLINNLFNLTHVFSGRYRTVGPWQLIDCVSQYNSSRSSCLLLSTNYAFCPFTTTTCIVLTDKSYIENGSTLHTLPEKMVCGGTHKIIVRRALCKCHVCPVLNPALHALNFKMLLHFVATVVPTLVVYTVNDTAT